MDRVLLCAECGQLLDEVALVKLLVTYEEDEVIGDIFEQVWHQDCYLKYANRQAEKQTTAA